MVGELAYDRAGREIGKVVDIYSDPMTLQPQWVLLQSGLMRHKHLVPAGAVREDDGRVQVPYDGEVVQHAPGPDQPGGPSAELTGVLRDLYHLEDGDSDRPKRQRSAGTGRTNAGSRQAKKGTRRS